MKTDSLSKTIFHSLIRNQNLPEAEKSDKRLADQASVLLGGRTDTTASTLAYTTYHLLSNPRILKKLRDELISAIPDPQDMPPLNKLEALPFLTAIVKLGIRLHPGASIRQERVALDEDLLYEDRKTGMKWLIPKGVSQGLFKVRGTNSLTKQDTRGSDCTSTK